MAKEEDGMQHKCERLYKYQYTFSTDAFLTEGLLEENQYVLNYDSFCQIVFVKLCRQKLIEGRSPNRGSKKIQVTDHWINTSDGMRKIWEKNYHWKTSKVHT